VAHKSLGKMCCVWSGIRIRTRGLGFGSPRQFHLQNSPNSDPWQLIPPDAFALKHGKGGGTFGYASFKCGSSDTFPPPSQKKNKRKKNFNCNKFTTYFCVRRSEVLPPQCNEMLNRHQTLVAAPSLAFGHAHGRTHMAGAKGGSINTIK